MIFRIEIDASDNNNTTALHYAAKYVLDFDFVDKKNGIK